MAAFILFLSLVVPLAILSSSFAQDYKTCLDYYNDGYNKSGIYALNVTGNQIATFCDQDTDGGGWIVIQRRRANDSRTSVLFNHDWSVYKIGFGDFTEEFWLGLENIYALTQETPMVLRIDLEDWEGTKRWAKYENFSISGADDNYRISFDAYEGGDAGDALSYHNGMMFTTYDRDNDKAKNINCARVHCGAWWFNDCLRSNLNGNDAEPNTPERTGIVWETFPALSLGIKAAQMAIRPYQNIDNTTEATFRIF